MFFIDRRENNSRGGKMWYVLLNYDESVVIIREVICSITCILNATDLGLA